MNPSFRQRRYHDHWVHYTIIAALCAAADGRIFLSGRRRSLALLSQSRMGAVVSADGRMLYFLSSLY